MGPIQPLGIGRPGWLDRPSTINDLSQTINSGRPGTGQAAPLMSGQTISAMDVSSNVSQLLSSIGGGAQNNQMLELMIALLIIMMSLVEQQKGGGQDALSKLSGVGSGLSMTNISYSSTVLSTQMTSLSYNELQVNQICGGQQAGGANQSQIDTTA